MGINAEAVSVLFDVDLGTLLTAMTTADKDQIRMRDGRQPNERQLAVIMNATSEDLEATRSLHQRAVESARDAADATQRMSDLLDKYADGSTWTTQQILPLMSPEERAEFIDLSSALFIPCEEDQR